MVSRASWLCTPIAGCACEVVLLLMVAMHVGAHWMIENPLTSLATCLYIYTVSWTEVWQHPRLRLFMESRGAEGCSTWLGMFGGRTPKPVRLYGSDKFLHHLRRWDPACIMFNPNSIRKCVRSKFKKSDTTVVYWDQQGRKRFKGSTRLKATQTYPLRFGRAVP